MIKKYTSISVIICLFFLSTSAYAETPVNQDPYEGFNRAMFTFNDTLDKAIFKPVATLYNKIIPKPLNKGIYNIFSNIDTIPTILNDLLQAKFYQATSDSWRLLINSTVGLLGFFDVAENLGLEKNYEDLGLTFAQWGYKKSNYLVLPFFGPSTIRDAIAMPANYHFLTVYPYINPESTRYQLYVLNKVSTRANLLHYNNVMEQAAVDRYAFVRSAYLQRREFDIQKTKEIPETYGAHKPADDLSAKPVEK